MGHPWGRKTCRQAPATFGAFARVAFLAGENQRKRSLLRNHNGVDLRRFILAGFLVSTMLQFGQMECVTTRVSPMSTLTIVSGTWQ
jgi:hypothetical protein